MTVIFSETFEIGNYRTGFYDKWIYITVWIPSQRLINLVINKLKDRNKQN